MCGYFCIRFIDFMLAGNTLVDFTIFSIFFSPSNFIRNDIILKYFMTNVQKMVESNSHEAHSIYPNLIDQQQFILNKINENKDHFVADIKERELMRKSQIGKLANTLLLLIILMSH